MQFYFFLQSLGTYLHRLFEKNRGSKQCGNFNLFEKVFVRANQFLKSEENTRNPGVWRAQDESPPAAAPSAAPAETVPSPAQSPSSPSPPTSTPAARSNRFKVVNSKNTQLFEHIFHNMTEEFR